MSKRQRPDPKRPSDSLNEDERKLYDVIRAKHDMGASKAELKAATGLVDKVVTRSLNSLKSENKIKEVQNINNRGLKHFMAIDFEPSKEITGGEWYTDGNLDMNFINHLKTFCVRMIQSRGAVTLESIWEVFCSRKISNVPLTKNQIEEIIENLLLDNDVMKVTSTGTEEFASIPFGRVCYKLTRKQTGVYGTRIGALASIPCGACPQISNCSPNGIISPQTCIYFKKWLEF